MSAILLAAAAVAAAVPKAAEAPSSYDQAVAARHAGDPALAVRLLDQWLSARPADVDARLHYGLALLALGRLDEAEDALGRVVAAAPNYRDALIGLAQIAKRRDDPGKSWTATSQLKPGTPERTVGGLRMAAAAVRRWRLDVGAGISAVGGGQPNWREASGQLRVDGARGASLTGRIEVTRRFGLVDIYGEVQREQRFSRTLSGYLVVGATPEADYRPQWQLGGGGGVRVRGGTTPTVLTIDVRHARYRTGSVSTFNPGLEQYLLNGKAWATGRLITLVERGSVRAGAFGRIDLEALPRLRLYAGAADAPDTSEGVVSRVRTLFGGAEVTLRSGQMLRASLAHVGQRTGADRVEFNIGAGVRF